MLAGSPGSGHKPWITRRAAHGLWEMSTTKRSEKHAEIARCGIEFFLCIPGDWILFMRYASVRLAEIPHAFPKSQDPWWQKIVQIHLKRQFLRFQTCAYLNFRFDKSSKFLLLSTNQFLLFRPIWRCCIQFAKVPRSLAPTKTTHLRPKSTGLINQPFRLGTGGDWVLGVGTGNRRCFAMNKQPFRLGTGGDWGFRGGDWGLGTSTWTTTIEVENWGGLGF